MKKQMILFFVIVCFIFANHTNSFCAIVSIDDVQVIPEQPTLNDIITFDVSGGFTHQGVTFDESVFYANGFALDLDLFFTEGYGPMIPDTWEHSENIGLLLEGDYDLLVQAYWRSSSELDYILHDTHTYGFDVIPEPFSFFLFGTGILFLSRKKEILAIVQ